MPALRLFGRKWLAASDDLVFPGLFEISFRIIWLILLIVVCIRFYPLTYSCGQGGHFVRAYLLGMLALLAIIIGLLIGLVNRSAQGSVTDLDARKSVAPILLVKIFLIGPELGLNILGTIWAFCGDIIQCNKEEYFSKMTIEALIIFDWVLFGLTIFGLAMVFDPVGSKRYYEAQETPGENIRQRKNTSLWLRRIRWAFCWVRSDEHGHEAFQQVAGLLSALFRSTDLVPSDVLTGCVLLRIKQKRETREKRRIQMLTDDEPKYSTDLRRIFSVAPKWMSLHNARHFLRLSMAAYGWPFVMYRYCATGAFRLASEVTCCAALRGKAARVQDDNCCLCNLAGVKHMSGIGQEDILFASFRNYVFELPFCVIADHQTSSIVVAIRGSISLRDIFTDLTATSERFDVEGMPENTMAHKGMINGAKFVEKRLRATGVLDRALNTYPDYNLILTGHSLGAGVACLLAILIRPKYPDVKVYAFSTPAGLISREAARVTESFVFTVGVGDDFVMRLGVDSVENLRTGIIQTLYATRLPKYRILMNGFGYTLFGIPPADLEKTWRNETDVSTVEGTSPLLTRRNLNLNLNLTSENGLLSTDLQVRRFAGTRLFTAGRILHIAHRKKTKAQRKSGTGGPNFEMRWAVAEDFMELRVMPRMLLDHLPENVYETLEIVLREQVRHIIDV